MNINIKEQKENIKNFLQNFEYNVMHEHGKKDVEHYFVVVTKKDINTPLLKMYFDMYVQKFPLNDVSKATNEFITNSLEDYYFVLIDSLEHNTPFFKEKDTFIRENANNIISYRMIGEAADITTHIENKLDNYLDTFKEISLSIGLLAKDKAKDKIMQGKLLLNKKTPVMKKGVQNLTNKISNRFKSLQKK